MANKIVGAEITDSAPTDKIIVARSGQLREMLVSAIGLHRVELTSEDAGLKTYTIYRSADDSTPFGTFEVQDGANGTGISINDYSGITPYVKGEVVIDDDGYAYRYISPTSLPGSKPQTAGVIHPRWERLFIGQEGQAEVITSDATAANANEYFADTTLAVLTLTNPAAVKSFVVEDYDDTWKNNTFTVDIGTDQFEFGIQQSGVRYTFRRIGAQFRASGTDGSVLWGNV